MAVYTKLNKSEIEEIISLYKLKNLETFAPIEEGIENTNYLISTRRQKFILTIFEKRVKKEDLPFFMKLMDKLSNFTFPKISSFQAIGSLSNLSLQ